jgi:hypothetical protein
LSVALVAVEPVAAVLVPKKLAMACGAEGELEEGEESAGLLVVPNGCFGGSGEKPARVVLAWGAVTRRHAAHHATSSSLSLTLTSGYVVEAHVVILFRLCNAKTEPSPQRNL